MFSEVRQYFLSVLVAMTFLIAGCAKKEELPKAEEHKSAEPESRVRRGTNGEVVITLDAATQKRMGLETAPLAATQLEPEAKGFGRVLDPAGLATAVVEMVAVRVTAETSQKELARLRALTEQNNASARSVEAAEAAAQRDASTAEASRARLLSSWGKAILSRDNLPGFAESLLAGECALVRLDLPVMETLKSQPLGARLFTLADENNPVNAEFIGPAPAVDPQMQGQGFLFLVKQNQSRLVPSVAVTGFLKLPGDAQSGVTLPRNAVLQFNGATWVYLQTGDETFQRTEVALMRPLESGWFVRERLKPQDKVVTVGAQQLLSEELKGQLGGD